MNDKSPRVVTQMAVLIFFMDDYLIHEFKKSYRKCVAKAERLSVHQFPLPALQSTQFAHTAFTYVNLQMVHNIQTQANCRYAADESKEESVGMIIGQSVKTGVQKGCNGEQGEAEQQKSSFHEMILTRELSYLPGS